MMIKKRGLNSVDTERIEGELAEVGEPSEDLLLGSRKFTRSCARESEANIHTSYRKVLPHLWPPWGLDLNSLCITAPWHYHQASQCLGSSGETAEPQP